MGTIPAPHQIVPNNNNIITGVNVVPVGPPINHPVLNPNNPFLQSQPAVPPQSQAFTLNQPVQPHTTTFVPPRGSQPQQPAANALPIGTFQQQFVPFTPAPWYFNGTENSGTLKPPST